MAINVVTICGNLVADCEKFKAGETYGIDFRVAVNEFSRDDEYANYFDVTFFGIRAKSLAEYMTKGKKIVITGRLHQDRWTKDDENRSAVKIIANDIEFASAKSEDSAPKKGAKKSKKTDDWD